MSLMVFVGTAPPDYRLYKDSIALSVPFSAAALMATAEGEAAVAAKITGMARERQLAEYPRTKLLAIDWVFAYTPEDIEAWPLPHDCDGCRECKTLGIDLLATSEVIICLGTMFCAEPAR